MSTIISGIQPSGKLTLGNYLGAIKNFVLLQDDLKENDELMVFIADMHAITVPQNPQDLRKSIKSLAALYIACGLDPERVFIFIQSEVKEHAELSYLLQTITYIGELERMTQYKDKMAKQVQGVSSALLTYPVLMAADILLYNSNFVPVGQDQKQHLELTRTLAERFNNRFGDTFNVPEPLIRKEGSKIMSLQNPAQKMSKSEPNEKATIFLLDDEATIRKKIASAVTDSDTKVYFDLENKPGVSNLMTIYAVIEKMSMDEVQEKFKDANYGTFKQSVADAIIKELKPIQEKYNEIINSPLLDEILNKGRDYASYKASKMITKVKRKMGLGRKQ